MRADFVSRVFNLCKCALISFSRAARLCSFLLFVFRSFSDPSLFDLCPRSLGAPVGKSRTPGSVALPAFFCSSFGAAVFSTGALPSGNLPVYIPIYIGSRWTMVQLGESPCVSFLFIGSGWAMAQLRESPCVLVHRFWMDLGSIYENPHAHSICTKTLSLSSCFRVFWRLP